jgi:L,D-peptidoglycan transpeptidase YkuD (ErfK/YbiS/YcfS/YnhG family)
MVAITLTMGERAQPFDMGSVSFGRSGFVAAAEKREGDGATPLGDWALMFGYYRADRIDTPRTGLMMHTLTPEHGWCDDPSSAAYNLPVRLPFSGRHERLWREDGLYDVIIVLSHNLMPPIAPLGSAIFLHCRGEDGAPTEGCIALPRQALIGLLHNVSPGDRLKIVR